ncbi:MAG: hypothetical protein BroJett014_13870 [Planctomycetota bacterium]|nr:MAG: hypothetical protein BroJett014_13870 [Planctomycetota bacterium]
MVPSDVNELGSRGAALKPEAARAASSTVAAKTYLRRGMCYLACGWPTKCWPINGTKLNREILSEMVATASEFPRPSGNIIASVRRLATYAKEARRESWLSSGFAGDANAGRAA